MKKPSIGSRGNRSVKEWWQAKVPLISSDWVYSTCISWCVCLCITWCSLLPYVVAQKDSWCSWHIWWTPFVPSSLSIIRHNNGYSVASEGVIVIKLCFELRCRNNGEFCRKKTGGLASFVRSKAASEMRSVFIRFLLILQYLILSPLISLFLSGGVGQ